MLKKWFKKESVDCVVQDMLYEAERLALQHHVVGEHHLAVGEHHLALANMYKTRVVRLKAQMTEAAK